MTWAWNPADSNAAIGFSNGNLTASVGNITIADHNVRGTASASSGKFYWEILVDAHDPGNTSFGIGICNGSTSLSGWPAIGGAVCWWNINTWDANGVNGQGAAPTFATNDRLGFALDATAQLVWVTKDGTIYYGASALGNPALGLNGLDISGFSGPYFPVFGADRNDTATAVPNSASWVYTPPSGFGELGAAGGDTIFAQSVM